MLQRIISIRNVGRFRDCVASGDVTFRRYTLIFAENARGKTTLCDVFRSLRKNDASIVIGRTTLGSPDPPEVRLLTTAGPIAFRNGVWAGNSPDIAVFDSTYIKENVFAGDSVDTEHRRNLYRVIIGAHGVTLAAQLNQLDEQIRIKNTEIRDNRTTIQRHIAPGITIEAFLAFPEDTEIDLKVAAKEQELQAARQSAQIQQKPGLTSLAAPVFPVAFPELLARTFANLAVDAERHVHDHVTQHSMQARGETWIAEGLEYVQDNSCPFCNQPIDAIELITDYRSYFSQEYHALRSEVDELKRRVEGSIGERTAAAIRETLIQNRNAAESWQQYCTFAPPTLQREDEFAGILAALHNSAQGLLDLKAGTPSILYLRMFNLLRLSPRSKRFALQSPITTRQLQLQTS